MIWFGWNFVPSVRLIRGKEPQNAYRLVRLCYQNSNISNIFFLILELEWTSVFKLILTMHRWPFLWTVPVLLKHKFRMINYRIGYDRQSLNLRFIDISSRAITNAREMTSKFDFVWFDCINNVQKTQFRVCFTFGDNFSIKLWNTHLNTYFVWVESTG